MWRTKRMTNDSKIATSLQNAVDEAKKNNWTNDEIIEFVTDYIYQ